MGYSELRLALGLPIKEVLGGPGKSSTHCSGQQSGDGAGLGPEGVLLLNGSEQRRDFQAAPSKDATTKFGW
jgi:hypothetical protein